ncbi:TBC1 domain family member 2B [Pelomyxa schiedti]|nr:TBC1 domain family member 2B [Pelomyxa schiedti]
MLEEVEGDVVPLLNCTRHSTVPDPEEPTTTGSTSAARSDHSHRGGEHAKRSKHSKYRRRHHNASDGDHARRHSSRSASPRNSESSSSTTTSASLAPEVNMALLAARDTSGFELDDVTAAKYAKYAKMYDSREAMLVKMWDTWRAKCGISGDNFPSRAKLVPLKEFRYLVYKGIPRKYRPRLWKIISGAADLQASEPSNYYRDLARRAEQEDTYFKVAIEKDLSRTFPNNSYFGDSDLGYVESLRHVLLAYSVRNRTVGYCQSMNVLAAWLILHLESEEDAFWVLCSIVEYLYQSYYTSSMLGAQIDLRILKELVTQNFPNEHQHLENMSLSLPLLCTKWFLCVFISLLPTETCLRVWDSFLLYGSMITFRISLSLFSQCSREIMSSTSPTDVIMLFQEKPLLCFNHPQLFRAIKRMDHITYKRLDFLHAKFSDEIKAEMNEVHKMRDVQQLQNLTRFSRTELVGLWTQFANFGQTDRSSRGSAVFNFDQFQQVFSAIVPGWQPNTPAMLQLFKIFDANGDNRIDFRELMVGLSLLSKGSVEERLHLCFRTYDPENTGYISKDDIVDMLRSVYKRAKCDNGLTLDTTILKMVNDMCQSLDIVGEGLISFEDFLQIVHCSPQLIEYFVIDQGQEATTLLYRPKNVVSLPDSFATKEPSRPNLKESASHDTTPSTGTPNTSIDSIDAVVNEFVYVSAESLLPGEVEEYQLHQQKCCLCRCNIL